MLLAAALLITLPYWLLQAIAHGKYRSGLRERMGNVPGRLRQKQRRTIWIHAVSVGEVLAISGLVSELRKRLSEFRIVVSTTTDAGQKLARERFGEVNVFYFPLDLKFAIRPYLRALQPDLVVLAETEFWPNFLRLAHEGGSRVAVVNARISDKSFEGYRRFRPLLRGVLKNIDLFLAQSDEDARRLHEIGAVAERIEVSGNLKYDLPATPERELTNALRTSFSRCAAGPVIVCGSTVAGEEQLLLNAFKTVLARYPQAVMLVAPRHPERFSEVSQLCERSGLTYWRRSQWDSQPISAGVFLVDSIGELASLYGLADVAFVGGSLVPRGGHNILEPAQHRVAILVGPHTENFQDIVSLFQSRDAVRVVTTENFAAVMLELLSNPAERLALGSRAAETLQSQTGATERTVAAILALLPRPKLHLPADQPHLPQASETVCMPQN